MYKKIARLLATVGAVAVAFSLLAFSGGAAIADGHAGAVFVLTDEAAGNAVAAFTRAANGSLAPAGRVATGGNGSGGTLGSQGALVLSDDGDRLYAVNAGSNTISFFAVDDHGLHLRGQVNSGGVKPISLTTHGALLYVLNAGGTPNITGFWIGDQGLQPIAGSTRMLSDGSGPAEVAFNPEGSVLAVTEKAANAIVTFTIGQQGTPTGSAMYPSSGAVPFGFAFDKLGRLIVSEAGAGAVSSYSVSDAGVVSVISPSVAAAGQIAACWIAVNKNGRYAYAANAGSGSITGYAIANDGRLSLLTPDALTAVPGGKPLDLDVSHDGRYLYEYNKVQARVNAYEIMTDGSLNPMGHAGALPASAGGIAVW